jgi:hypothetical protein
MRVHVLVVQDRFGDDRIEVEATLPARFVHGDEVRSRSSWSRRERLSLPW